MNVIVNDPRAPVPPRETTPPAPPPATRFEDVLAAIEGAKTLSFAATGPAGLAHSVSTPPARARRATPSIERAPSTEPAYSSQATPRHSAPDPSLNLSEPTGAPDKHAAPTHGSQAAAAMIGAAPSSAHPEARVETRLKSGAALGAPSGVTQAKTQRGAGAASPHAVRVSTAADGVHVHVTALGDAREIQQLRRAIEGFFAERGLRVHLHINGARVDGLEDTHG